MDNEANPPAPVPSDPAHQNAEISSPPTAENIEITGGGHSSAKIEKAKRAMEIYERTTVYNPYFPKEALKGPTNPEGKPHKQQMRFLLHSETLEVFFGGSVGGGKTAAMLMAALQFVETPGYAALLLRSSFPDLNQPGALIPLSKEWLKPFEKEGVRWSERDRRWTFPSGATITFGYLERPDDKYQYQGSAFSMVGWDELSHHSEENYRYLFSRLRRVEGVDVPLRMRATGNPGGKHAEWVKNRFIDPKGRKEHKCKFIPAGLKDNPSLNYDEYVKSLLHLDPITRKQLLEGDWEAYKGGRFQLDWFKNHTWRFDGQRFQLTHGNMECGAGIPVGQCPIIVTVDHANTIKTSSDYTVFLACAVTPWKQLLVLDMKREKMPVEQIPLLLKGFCRRIEDHFGHPAVWAGVEANGAQVAIANQCRVLPGMVPIKYLQPGNQDKLIRATPAILAAEQGLLYIPHNAPAWLENFVYELVQFTGDPKIDPHDDICLAEGTLVSTAEGEKPIESVNPGDKVLTREGYKPVLAAGMTGEDELWWEVVLEDGRTLLGTENHPVWVENLGWTRIDMITTGDKVIVCDEKKSSTEASSLFAIPTPRTDRHVYTSDRHPKNQECRICTGKFGWTTSDQYLRSSTFITRTRTATTIPQKTSNASVLPNTIENTTILSASKNYARGRNGGIPAKRAENGIENNLRKCDQSEVPSKEHAKDAELSFKPHPHNTEDVSALALVAPNGPETSVSTKNQGRVLGAERVFPAFRPKNSSFVLARVLCVRATQRKGRVYNLTVEDSHEFFANGVLVHNCDCLAYAALNMGFAHFQAPTTAGERGKGKTPQDRWRGGQNNDGISRVFGRAGRMRRLFGN